jgi:hypothetical protein
MIEDRVIRMFLHRHPFQMVADEMEARGPGVEIMHHLHILTTSKLSPVIRARVIRHRRLDLMRWKMKRIADRRPIRPITIRNFFTGT